MSGAPASPERFAPRPSGLSLAALTLGVVGLLIAVGCWIAWLAMVGLFDLPTGFYGGIGLLTLAIGALWAAMVPVSTLAVIYGGISRRRNKAETSDRDNLARAGVVTGALALLVALAGAIVFALSINQASVPGPPRVVPMPGIVGQSH